MNRIQLIAMMSACLISCHSAQTADGASSIPGGAIGYWSFDDTTLDRGVILKATVIAGIAGEALQIDGESGGVTFEGLSSTGKQHSISLWINKQGGDVRRLIVINDLFQIGFTGNQLFVHTGRVGRADTNLPLAEVDVAPNKWTHLAVTWDTAAARDHVKVYINGALRLKAHLEATRGRDLTIDTLNLGHMGPQHEVAQVFAGGVDELAVYNRALQPDEIRAYYARTLAAAGKRPPRAVPARVITQGSVEPPEAYYPRNPYKGRKKLLRIGSELISRMLGSRSIAEADLPTRVKQWQQTGLDGCVFTITSTDRGNLDRYWNMNGQWWAIVPRTYEELEPDIKAFQAVKDWGRLTDNFLWSSYAVWKDGPKIKVQDWFNDDHWKIILANLTLQARVAKECGFKGILFDVEQYEGHHALGAWHIPFSYPNYSEDGYKLAGESAPRPFDEVAAKIRRRGEQYARALCSEFPGIKLILIPGLYEWTTRLGDGPLAGNHNGLYPSFLDGVLAGLDDKATLIGGTELTYDHTRYRDMGKVRKAFDEAIDKLCSTSDERKKKLSFAVGVWADSGRTWSDTDVSKNLRIPEDHEDAIRNAFTASDEYAWLYGEQSFFLTTTPTQVMREYFKANEDAHSTE